MRKPFPNMLIRTKLLASYGVIVCFAIISSSILTFGVSRQVITEHARSQNHYLAEQLAVNLAAQFKSMEELQFSQYNYSQLGSLLALTPEDDYGRTNRERKINDCLIRLCYARTYINGACVVDNAGTLYTVSINRELDAAQAASRIDVAEVIGKHGKPVWSVSDEGRLLMSRLLININDTRTVGIVTLLIDPAFITQVYEKDAKGKSGEIVLYDAQRCLLPAAQPEIDAIAAEYLLDGMREDDAPLFFSGGESYIISGVRLPGNDFSLLNIIPVSALGEYTRSLPTITAIVALIALLTAACMARLVSGRVTVGIRNLVAGIRRFAAGDLHTQIHADSHDEIGYLNVEFQRMMRDINKLIENARAAEANKKSAELNALQFEYNALEAKINPHFLYNTLESVNSLAKLKGEDEISEIVCLLGKLLRDNISATTDIIQLAREIQNIEIYLHIQRLTYGDKFEVEIRLDNGTERALVPKFILQPLVENAIIHGVLCNKGKGRITLHARCTEDLLHIVLGDDGVGIPEEDLKQLLDYSVEARDETGTHAKVGVRAVDKRIKILYGEDFGLSIDSEFGGGTRVLIAMPLSFPQESEEGGERDDESSRD